MTCGTPRAVVLAKKTTREIVGRYPSARAASFGTGVSYSVILRACNKRLLGEGFLYFRYEDDFDPSESFENATKLRPVLALNMRTGHWLWFESISEAGIYFYGHDEGARRAMKNGRSRYGYVFVYADKRMRSEKCEVGA